MELNDHLIIKEQVFCTSYKECQDVLSKAKEANILTQKIDFVNPNNEHHQVHIWLGFADGKVRIQDYPILDGVVSQSYWEFIEECNRIIENNKVSDKRRFVGLNEVIVCQNKIEEEILQQLAENLGFDLISTCINERKSSNFFPIAWNLHTGVFFTTYESMEHSFVMVNATNFFDRLVQCAHGSEFKEVNKIIEEYYSKATKTVIPRVLDRNIIMMIKPYDHHNHEEFKKIANEMSVGIEEKVHQYITGIQVLGGTIQISYWDQLPNNALFNFIELEKYNPELFFALLGCTNSEGFHVGQWFHRSGDITDVYKYNGPYKGKHLFVSIDGRREIEVQNEVERDNRFCKMSPNEILDVFGIPQQITIDNMSHQELKNEAEELLSGIKPDESDKKLTPSDEEYYQGGVWYLCVKDFGSFKKGTSYRYEGGNNFSANNKFVNSGGWHLTNDVFIKYDFEEESDPNFQFPEEMIEEVKRIIQKTASEVMNDIWKIAGRKEQDVITSGSPMGAPLEFDVNFSLKGEDNYPDAVIARESAKAFGIKKYDRANYMLGFMMGLEYANSTKETSEE